MKKESRLKQKIFHFQCYSYCEELELSGSQTTGLMISPHCTIVAPCNVTPDFECPCGSKAQMQVVREWLTDRGPCMIDEEEKPSDRHFICSTPFFIEEGHCLPPCEKITNGDDPYPRCILIPGKNVVWIETKDKR